MNVTTVMYALISTPWYTACMKWFHEMPLEPGLLKIFRVFALGVSIFFFLFYSFPAPMFPTLGPYPRMLSFMGLSYGLLFVYLIVPKIQDILKNYYLPLAILASIFIPMGFINWAPHAPLDLPDSMSLAIHPINTWTVTILMLFPLVITAWQYSFKIVLIFFAGLGIIDPLIAIFIYEMGTLSLYMAIYASAVRIIAFTAIGFVITELMKNQRRRQQDLATANRKLQEYARQIREFAIIRERNRLAAELHDVLAHTLSGLTVHLEALDAVIPHDQEMLRRELRKAIESSREGLRETRRALHDLRAEPIEEFGLHLAVKHLIDQYARRGGIAIDVQYSSSIPQLSPPVEQNVYRIIQESLENVIRHARAAYCLIHIFCKEEHLKLIIEDDGIGFAPETVDTRSHFGITTIRDRAANLAGTLSVTSPKKDGLPGTRIEITIPLEKCYDPNYHM